jgi:hypothetical protein
MLRAKYAARGAVIERHTDRATQVVGFGFAVFARKEFVAAELRHPKPGLNARIIEDVLDGPDPLASFEEIRDANTRGDLQQIILDSSWDNEILTSVQRDEVRALLGVSYGEAFAGYRISRAICEVVDMLDVWNAGGHPGFEVVDRFERFHAEHPASAWSSERALGVITLETIRNYPGSIPAGIFGQHRLPCLGFTQGEKDLLEAAIDGLDDASASSELDVSLSAIKKRWGTIFARIAARMPELCPSDASDTRGAQKRHHVLTYLRHHPEELRPFAERGK